MRPPQHGNVHFAKIKPISKQNQNKIKTKSKQNQNKILGCIFKGEMTFFVAEKKKYSQKKKEFSPPKIFLV